MHYIVLNASIIERILLFSQFVMLQRVENIIYSAAAQIRSVVSLATIYFKSRREQLLALIR